MHRIVIACRDEKLGGELAETVRGAGYEAKSFARVTELGDPLRAGEADVALIWCDAFHEPSQAEGADRVEALLRDHPSVPLVVAGASPPPRQIVAWRRLGDIELLPALLDVSALEAALGRLARRGEQGSSSSDWSEWARSPAMCRLLCAADAAATTEATVLVIGETGSGTTTVARRVHRLSTRASAPLVEIDCATLRSSDAPKALDGAWRRSRLADGAAGTLVLDHLDELDPALGATLLDAWDASDAAVRVIATARRPLRAGPLPAELVYRFDVIGLEVPPLRDRSEAVGDLAAELLRCAAARAGLEEPRLGVRARELLAEHRFPGNVAELAALMERAVLLFPGAEVDVGTLLGVRSGSVAFVVRSVNLRELEEAAIRRSLIASGGNRSRASEALGISARTLRNKIRLYGLAELGRHI